MITTRGGPCLRRVPGFWYGAGPHTPAQRVWPPHAPLMGQDGNASSSQGKRAPGWPGQRRTDHAGHRPGRARETRREGGAGKARGDFPGLETCGEEN
jgi:hypothetical protein